MLQLGKVIVQREISIDGYYVVVNREVKLSGNDVKGVLKVRADTFEVQGGGSIEVPRIAVVAKRSISVDSSIKSVAGSQ